MNFPTIGDYIAVLKASKAAPQVLRDPFLTKGDFVLASDGTPLRYAGNFAVAFKFQSKNKSYAIRCWKQNPDNTQLQAQKVETYLQQTSLPYFVNFTHVEKGVLVNGTIYPIIRMEWVEGLNLKEYLEANLGNPQALQNLARKFRQMTRDLHAHHISHGDLQHENLKILPDGNLKLIDYDSMYVPTLAGEKDSIKGVPGYQHPGRIRLKELSEKSDYFSELLIYLMIVSLSVEPALWKEFNLGDDDTLYFVNRDFSYPEITQTPGFQRLSKLNDPQINGLLSVLEAYCKEQDILNLRDFDHELAAFEQPPVIKHFKADRYLLDNIPNKSVTLSWEVQNAAEVELLNIQTGLGYSGSHTLDILKDMRISLVAKNYLGDEVRQDLDIRVSKQAPVIHLFDVDKHIAIETDNLEFTWQVDGAERLVFTSSLGQRDVTGKKNTRVMATHNSQYELRAISYFGVENCQQISVMVKPLPQIRNIQLPDLEPTVLPDGKELLAGALRFSQQVPDLNSALGQVLTTVPALPLSSTSEKKGLFHKVMSFIKKRRINRRIKKQSYRQLKSIIS